MGLGKYTREERRASIKINDYRTRIRHHIKAIKLIESKIEELELLLNGKYKPRKLKT